MALHSAILPCLSTHLTPKAINGERLSPPLLHPGDTLFLVLWGAGRRENPEIGNRLGKEKKKGGRGRGKAGRTRIHKNRNEASSGEEAGLIHFFVYFWFCFLFIPNDGLGKLKPPR